MGREGEKGEGAEFEEPEEHLKGGFQLAMEDVCMSGT
jgi:hypothetical protein